MKKVIGYIAVGLAGYFIGFYEHAYRTQKALLSVIVEKFEEEEPKE